MAMSTGPITSTLRT